MENHDTNKIAPRGDRTPDTAKRPEKPPDHGIIPPQIELGKEFPTATKLDIGFFCDIHAKRGSGGDAAL